MLKNKEELAAFFASNCAECVDLVHVATGSGGGESHRNWQEDQGRGGGGSQVGHTLGRVCLQRRRKTRQNQRLQGHLTGQTEQSTQTWFEMNR